MFTGIVAACGRVRTVEPAEKGARAVIAASALDLSDVRVGDSIAVDGCCLTVVALNGDAVSFDVSEETLGCTIGFDPGRAVNLEKAVRLADRLGGHLVSGHVDAVGQVTRLQPIGDCWLLEVRVPDELARYLVRKGSVAVNGVSLTANQVQGSVFSVNLIPHTLQVTNLGMLKEGARVNVEVDMLARYVERLLAAPSIDQP
jgi:riboflavin synthase